MVGGAGDKGCCFNDINQPKPSSSYLEVPSFWFLVSREIGTQPRLVMLELALELLQNILGLLNLVGRLLNLRGNWEFLIDFPATCNLPQFGRLRKDQDIFWPCGSGGYKLPEMVSIFQNSLEFTMLTSIRTMILAAVL